MADVEKAAIAGGAPGVSGKPAAGGRSVGIGERTLYRKIKDYQLE